MPHAELLRRNDLGRDGRREQASEGPVEPGRFVNPVTWSARSRNEPHEQVTRQVLQRRRARSAKYRRERSGPKRQRKYPYMVDVRNKTRDFARNETSSALKRTDSDSRRYMRDQLPRELKRAITLRKRSNRGKRGDRKRSASAKKNVFGGTAQPAVGWGRTSVPASVVMTDGYQKDRQRECKPTTVQPSPVMQVERAETVPDGTETGL